MSEEIEEELEKYYKCLNFEVKYVNIREYEISCSLQLLRYEIGFEFNYHYNNNFTFSSNIEQIKTIINKMIIKQFRRGNYE